MHKALGIEKHLEKVIKVLFKREASTVSLFLFMSNYSLGHSFNADHLFERFPIKKSKVDRRKAKSIFISALEYIINDIIENNVEFKLPGIGSSYGTIFVNRTTGDSFKKAFKNGKWRDVDFITSNFSGYQLALKMCHERKLPKKKPIYLSPRDKQKLTDKTNEGKQY